MKGQGGDHITSSAIIENGTSTTFYSGTSINATSVTSSTFLGNLTGTASWATNAVNAITTASVNLNTITFTKGDGSTFPITVDTGSGGGGSAFPFTGDAQITGSLSVTGSIVSTLGFTGSLLGTATTASFIDTANLTTLPTAIAFSAPLASIASGGTAAETTITSFSIPAGVLKTGDNILYTVWGNRTSGAATGVNSTLNSRVTDINGSLIFGFATGNRHHNYTLTGRVLSDTSIVWWQNSVTTAAVSTTVPSLASSGFTINLSVVRDLNTSTFTLYNAILRKYN
jgi:hypothetical protein